MHAALRNTLAKMGTGPGREWALLAAMGAAAATSVAGSVCQFLVSLGAGASAHLAVIIALWVSLFAAWLLTRQGIRPSHAAWYWLAAAGSTVLSPLLLHISERLLARPGWLSLHSPGWNTLTLGLLAVPCVAVPATAWLAALAGLHDRSQAGRHRAARMWRWACIAGGAWLGLTLEWFVGASSLGFYNVSLCGAALAAVLCVFHWMRATGTNGPQPAAGEVEPMVPRRVWASVCALAIRCLLVCACGVMLAALRRMLHQLSPTGLALTGTEASAVLAGLGLAWARQAGAASGGWLRRDALIPAAACASWSVAMLIAFPGLMWLSLTASSYVNGSLLLTSLRCALALITLLPGMWAAATYILGVDGDARPALRGDWLLPLACAGLGERLGAALLLPRWGCPLTLCAAAWLIVGVAGVAWWRRSGVLRTRMRRLAAAGVLTLVVAGPMWESSYNPQRSAKTLFSTAVFMAHRSGFPWDLLPALDDGRCIARQEGVDSTWTVWKHGPAQCQLRENGLPRGSTSCDPLAFPQFAGEVLPIVYPLTLHPSPRRILVLGLGSGRALTSCIGFPLQDIHCAESDGSAVELAGALHSRGKSGPAWTDDRVRIFPVEEKLCLLADAPPYDVIVSLPGHCVPLRAQTALTSEFYSAAARRLGRDGLFAQRLQFVDLGPDALRPIVRTLQTAFRSTLAIEMAPGELLLLGANSEQKIVRPELLARVQARHVRHVLAELGFDWCILLNLPAYNTADLRKFAQHSRPNSIFDLHLALRLPLEVQRWAPKLQEMQETLGKSAGRLANWMGEDGESKVLVQRLAEVRGQQDLLIKYSDQYWAYRASLREQISARPRSTIQQTSGEAQRRLHPEDRERVRYFAALGRAVKTTRLADLRALSEFGQPYDPLLTYFARQESAELMSIATPRPVAEELRLRLHAVYFTSPADPSLRTVLAALQLLHDHPSALPEPLDRWDTCQSLLQMLQMRWEARAGVKPGSTDGVLTDIDLTIAATQRTLGDLETLWPETGLPRETWSARRRVIEKVIIRPLQAYRVQVAATQKRAPAPRGLAEQASMAAAASQSPAPRAGLEGPEHGAPTEDNPPQHTMPK